MRHYCKCRHRFVLTVCKSVEDRQPLECNADCWKFQRDQRLANAFGSSKDFEDNKELIQFEYFPEDILEYAENHQKFAQKVESLLTDVVLKNSSRSFAGLTGQKHNFLSTYVYEHFRLDMCTYRSKAGGTTVADVFWKEGCRVPEILATEIIALVNKGIMTQNSADRRSQVFQASIVFPIIPKGSSIQDVKALFLGPGYANAFYAEKKGTSHVNRKVILHFYQYARATEALTMLRSTWHPFECIEMISHQKQVGVGADGVGFQSSGLTVEPAKRARAEKYDVDDEGFTVIKKS